MKEHAFDCTCVIHTPFSEKVEISKTRPCSCGVGNPNVPVPAPQESDEEQKAEAYRRWLREFGSAANGRKGGRPRKVKG